MKIAASPQAFLCSPTQGAADHRAEIERLAQAVKQSGQQAGAVDLTGIMSQLHSIEQTIRHKTEYRLSRYVKFGGTLTR